MRQNPRDIIFKPVVTEKTIQMQNDDNIVTFEVARHANKVAIKQAIEEIFDVKVEKINVVNVLPRKKRMGQYEGKTKHVKKAIVKLKDGYNIDII